MYQNVCEAWQLFNLLIYSFSVAGTRPMTPWQATQNHINAIPTTMKV